MKKVGFIGFGHMAKSMCNTFVKKNTFQKNQLFVSEIPEVAKKLQEDPLWTKINIMSDNKSLAESCDILFLGTKPLTSPLILDSIKNITKETQHLISMAACLKIEEIEKLFKGKITRILPSITSETPYGVTFFTHNKKVNTDDKREIETILSSLGIIKELKEEDYKFALNLTSSAPGIISGIFDMYTASAIKNFSITLEEASKMVMLTVLGTMSMLMNENLTFSQLSEKVATKGGITESVLNVLKEHLPTLFDKAFAASIEKSNLIESSIKERK